MSKIKVFDSIKDFIEYRNTELKNKTIGFVPTMGALHAGHASLIEKSALENEITVLSIYINPTQFNNSNDLSTYPKTLTADIKLAEQSGAQVIITPKYSEIYPDLYTYKIIECEFSKILCGATRVGHFDGVLTIVMKLLQIVSAQKAYFGQKDYQQYLLIKNMKEAFFLQTEIIALPTKREASGLAMSSRNTRLSENAKALAAFIYQGLQIENITDAALFLKNKNIEIEYLEEHFNRRFVAAHIDGVRLIDNVAI